MVTPSASKNPFPSKLSDSVKFSERLKLSNIESNSIITVAEIAENAGIVDSYPDHGFFSDGEEGKKKKTKQFKTPPLISTKQMEAISPRGTEAAGNLEPSAVLVRVKNVENKRSGVASPMVNRVKRSRSLTSKLDSSDFIEKPEKKENFTEKKDKWGFFKQDSSLIVKQALDENFLPSKILRSAFHTAGIHSKEKHLEYSPSISLHLSASQAIKERMKRLTTCAQVLTIGYCWKADKVETIRKQLNPTQLFRGQLMFESITINGVPFPTLSEEEKKDFSDTKIYELNEIPPLVLKFYTDLFLSLAAHGVDLNEEKISNSLERLFKHKKIKKTDKKCSRFVYKFLLLTNMSCFGFGTNTFTEMFPKLFDKNPYATSPKLIKEDGTAISFPHSLDVLVKDDGIRVIQKRKFMSSLKATGAQLSNTPISSYLVSWDALLPESRKKFTADLKISDFAWDPDVDEKTKEEFTAAFLDLEDEAEL